MTRAGGGAAGSRHHNLCTRSSGSPSQPSIDDTGGHIRRVAASSADIPAALGIGPEGARADPPRDAPNDVGRIEIPNAVLLKPVGSRAMSSLR